MSHQAWVLLGLSFVATPCVAQRPYAQIGGGLAAGARQVSQPSGSDFFVTGGLTLGLALRSFMVRVDGRAFDTETEPLLTVGVAIGVPLVRAASVEPYLLVGGGLGAFVEEGDPGEHVGVGVGVATRGPVGFYGEIRFDHLLGTFTYSERHRALGSAVVGIRLGRT